MDLAVFRNLKVGDVVEIVVCDAHPHLVGAAAKVIGLPFFDIVSVSCFYNTLWFYCHEIKMPGDVVSKKASSSAYPHKCQRCRGPAYIGFNQVDCPKCGKY
jgi:hypothetical protein